MALVLSSPLLGLSYGWGCFLGVEVVLFFLFVFFLMSPGL